MPVWRVRGQVRSREKVLQRPSRAAATPWPILSPYPHTTPPPECLRLLTPFVGRGAMGSHLRVVRPGWPSRLREWLCHSRSREGLLGAPRRAPVAPQSLRALWGGRARPACRPLLPSSGRRAGFQRKTLLRRRELTPDPGQGRAWVLAVKKGFSRGKHALLFLFRNHKFWIFGASFFDSNIHSEMEILDPGQFMDPWRQLFCRNFPLRNGKSWILDKLWSSEGTESGSSAPPFLATITHSDLGNLGAWTISRLLAPAVLVTIPHSELENLGPWTNHGSQKGRLRDLWRQLLFDPNALFRHGKSVILDVSSAIHKLLPPGAFPTRILHIRVRFR